MPPRWSVGLHTDYYKRADAQRMGQILLFQGKRTQRRPIRGFLEYNVPLLPQRVRLLQEGYRLVIGKVQPVLHLLTERVHRAHLFLQF